MVSWEIVKRFFEPAFISRRKLAAFSFVFLLRRLYDFGNVLFIKKIVWAIEWDNTGLLKRYIILFIVFVIVYQVVSYFWLKKYGFYEKEIKKYLYETYFEKLTHLDNNILESYGTWKIISTMKIWLDSWYQFIETILMKSISMISTLFFCGILVAHISYTYFFIFLIISILFDYLSIQIGKRWLNYRTKKYDIQNEANRQMTRFIMSRNEIIQNNKGEFEAKNIWKTLVASFEEGMKQWPYEHFSYNSADIWLSLAKITILFGIGKMVIQWSIAMSELVWIIAIVSYLSKATQDFLDAIKRYLKNGVNITKLRDLFDNTPLIQWYQTWNKFSLTHWSISLSHISYWYNVNNPVFSNFSLDLQAKKKTALVGPSWGGKSTLIKLIAGYIRPDSWNILIDRQSIVASNGDHVSLQSYYAHIGYLTQEPSVFDGTVRENLEYGINNSQWVMIKSQWKKIEQKMKSWESYNWELSNIISLAKCEWIYDLPDGLDTEIGERWVRLSWGQKQRLAIAKIMLKNPSIILLDEPTSALDSYNEEQVTIALNNLFKNKTVIVIAHRLQTVKHADEIIFISDGTITERGTHEELLALHGEYYKMVELQSGF